MKWQRLRQVSIWAVSFFMLCLPFQTLAIAEVTLHKILTGSQMADEGNSCSGGSVNFGAGTLPSSVPAPYNGIFTAAGNPSSVKPFSVAPALVAAIFYGGEHGNSWPNPPPPYGSGGPWATSILGAEGPFQFLPSTWATYGLSANGQGGSPNIQDLADAAFGAANYLGKSGAENTTDPTKLQGAIFAYNHSSAYVASVMAAYTMFSGGSPSPTPGPTPTTPSSCTSTTTTGNGSGSFQNPFRSVSGLAPNRIDEGVDYGGTGSVYAVGPGVVTAVFTPKHPGIWWNKDGGNSVVYQIDPGNGPASGKYIYFAEDCTPTVSVGNPVTSSTVICNMYNGGDAIETGWAMGNGTDEPMAGPDYYPKVPDGTAMAYGRNFSAFLQSIPDTPGGVLADSTNPSVVGGSLQSGWPTSW
jgi:hypothetical protein